MSFVGHRVDGAGAGDVRKLALDIRGRMPAGKPSVVAIIGSTNGKPRWSSRSTTRPGRGASPRTRWSRSPRRLSAAAAAARTTSPRAAAPTSPTSTRRCVDVEHEVGRAVTSRTVLTVRFGVRLGVDVGDVRIGVARSDPSGACSRPRWRPCAAAPATSPGSARSAEDEEAAVEVVVGLPRSLSGGEGPAAAKVREFAGRSRRPWRPCAGAAVRRAIEHGHRRGGTARAGQEGTEAACRRRPGGRRGDPAERAGHRTQHGAAPGEALDLGTT